MKVSLADKREFEAEIVLKDARTDLAVLRVKDGSERFPAIEFANSDALQVGDVVLAIGNPFGVGQTVTHGIVSALARTQVGITDYQFFIQTDAAINPGNSGGALVDLPGKLVGINTAIFSRSGGSQGIGFAIPANMVKVVVASAKTGGSAVKRPWLGAKLQAVTPEIAESLGLKRPAGALVANVSRRKPGGARPGSRPATSSSRSTARRSMIRMPSTIASPPSRSAAARSSASCAAARRRRVTVALRDRARNAARRDRDPARARRSSGVKVAKSRPRSPTNCGSMPRPKAWSCSKSPTARWRRTSASSAATSIAAVNERERSTHARPRTRSTRRTTSARWRITIVRGGQTDFRRRSAG